MYEKDQYNELRARAEKILQKENLVPDDLSPEDIEALVYELRQTRQREQAFRALVENSLDAIVRIDRESRHLYVNPAFARALGLPAEEIIGKTNAELGVSEKLQAKFDAARHEIYKTGAEVYIEFSYTTPAGERYFRTCLAPEFSGDRSVETIVSITHDITERRRAEEALQESEKRYHSLFVHMRSGFAYHRIVVDAERQPVDYIFLEVNDSFEEITGLKREDVIGKSVTEVLPEIKEEDFDWIGVYGQVALTGESMQIEQCFERRRRCYAVSAYSPQPDHFVTIFEDITERKRMEDNLKEREERFRLLAENAQDIIYRIQVAPELRFDYVSPSVTEVTGYTPEDHYTDPELGYKLVHPDDRHVLQTIQQQSSTEPLVLRWVCKDGTVIWTEQQNTLVFDEAGNIIAVEGIARDITERKRMEEILREQYNKLDRFFTLAIDLLCIANVDGEFVKVNKAWEMTLGYPVEELEGRQFLDFVHPDDLQPTLDAIAQLSSQQPLLNFTNRYRAKDGSYRTIEWRSHPEGRLIYAAARDITERNQAEQALRESEERYRLLAQNVTDMISIHTPEGIYTFVTPSSEMVLGYTPDELIGRSAYDFFHPEDLKAIQHSHQAIMDRSVNFNLIYRIRRKDGQYIWFETISRTVWNETTGELIEIIAVSRDVTERKKAEEALRESEERLHLTLQSTRSGLWEWNVQTGETVFNERWAEIVGYDLAELSPVSIQTWIDLVHPDDLQTSNELLYKHFRGELAHYECEVRMRHKDGHWVWVLDRGQVMRWTEEGDPLRMFGTHTDITERKQAEQALRARTRTLQSMHEVALDVSSALELSVVLSRVLQHAQLLLDAGQTGGIALHRDDGLLHVLESYGTTLIAPGTTLEPGQGLAGIAFRQAQPVTVADYATWEHRLTALENETFGPGLGIPLRWRKQVIGVMFVIGHPDRCPFEPSDVWLAEMLVAQATIAIVNADLYEQQQQHSLMLQEEVHRQTTEIRRQHEQTQAILQNIGDAVLFTDTAGNITYVNRAFTHLLGYEPEDVTGKHISLLKSQSAVFSAEYLLEAVAERRFWRDEMLARCKDGTLCEVEYNFVPVPGPSGEVEGFVTSIRDIGRFKQFDRMKTRFMQTVSHELRTPLSSIRLYTSLLQSEKATDETKRKRYLEKLDTQTNRLVGTAEKVLDATRFTGSDGPESRRTISAAEILKDAVTRLESAATAANKTVIADLPPHPLHLQGNPVWLARALDELIENAIKFTTEGSVITLSARPVQEEDTSKIAIDVHDEGEGIDETHLRQIYEVFERGIFTETGHVPGIGLGLFIVQLILKHHHGELLVESALQQGSTFTLLLPTFE